MPLFPITPDYDHSLVSLSNSVRGAFGLSPLHETLPLADAAFASKKQNLVILLLDGLGISTLEEHLPPESFLRRHLAETFHSVFPPTTVAATTSLLSGLSPAEHGWLGWDMYFPEIDESVSLFPNTKSRSQAPAKAPNMAWRTFPYTPLPEQIQTAGYHAYYSSAYEKPYPTRFSEILERTQALCALPQRKLIYTYYEQPDALEHIHGVHSREVHELLQDMDRTIAQFAAGLRDTTLCIIADHGHIDIHGVNLAAHTDLMACLLRGPTIEARAASLFVAPGQEEYFKTRFQEQYGAHFRLISMEQAFAAGLFGPGTRHPKLAGAIGNYLAVATDRYALFANAFQCKKYIGHHAGLTQAELEIPCILVDG